MAIILKAWTPAPLARLRLGWLPVCSEDGRRYCLEKDHSETCHFHLSTRKDKCRRITITIGEAQDGLLP